MKYISVCSGIEAATVAWHPLGWQPAWFSEIEPFPSAVLQHHYPDTQNLGDMTKFKDWQNDSIDLLVGGTPCQSFSVAGLRKGLDDPRGNLMLTYLAILAKYSPKWMVWENVPGVLSSNDGRDFGTFLGALGQLGYGFAYRVLDAQYFGVPQRRRRVFVVGCLGSWRSAAAVLFERHSLQGHPKPSKKTNEEATLNVAPCLRAQSSPSHRLDSEAYVAGTLDAGSGRRRGSGISPESLVVSELFNAEGSDGATLTRANIGKTLNNQTPLVVHGTQDPCISENAFALGRNAGQENVVVSQYGDKAGALTASHDAGVCADRGPTIVAIPIHDKATRHKSHSSDRAAADGSGNGLCIGGENDPMFTLLTGDKHAVAFSAKDYGGDATVELSPTLRTGGHNKSHANSGNWMAVQLHMTVRRLTPIECERLQGFPDGWTQIPWRNKPAEQCPDGPRYKALGNSMAVPCMSWLGRRIQMVDAIEAAA